MATAAAWAVGSLAAAGLGWVARKPLASAVSYVMVPSSIARLKKAEASSPRHWCARGSLISCVCMHAQEPMFEGIGCEIQHLDVKCDDGNVIHTVIASELMDGKATDAKSSGAAAAADSKSESKGESKAAASASASSQHQKPPLLLLHGFGGGLALWVKNFAALSQHYTVYAIDILGFGTSSRPEFDAEGKEQHAEAWWVASIESWRRAMKIEGALTVLGHSLGGFIATEYALRHPERCARLVVVSPFGVVKSTGFSQERLRTAPFLLRTAFRVMAASSPQVISF